jgi:hypothetical protein
MCVPHEFFDHTGSDLTGQQGRTILPAAAERLAGVWRRYKQIWVNSCPQVRPVIRWQRWSEGRIAELERKIGQQALEIDFLKGCLQRIEEQRMLQAVTGNPRSTGRSKKSEGRSRTDD